MTNVSDTLGRSNQTLDMQQVAGCALTSDLDRQRSFPGQRRKCHCNDRVPFTGFYLSPQKTVTIDQTAWNVSFDSLHLFRGLNPFASLPMY